jgi:hypothetical protein
LFVSFVQITFCAHSFGCADSAYSVRLARLAFAVRQKVKVFANARSIGRIGTEVVFFIAREARMCVQASQTSIQIHSTVKTRIIEESKGIVETISAAINCNMAGGAVNSTFKAPFSREVSTSGAH